MLPALLGLVGAGSALFGKLAKDDDDRKREAREREMFRRQQILGDLNARAQNSGVDTSFSPGNAGFEQQQFLAQLAGQRRNTSGDWVPFVQSLGSVAQDVVPQVVNSPKLKPDGLSAALDAQQQQPQFQGYDDERDEYLRMLAGRRF